MFCIESFSRSPNDLYNHITEVHKRETDELTNNNNNNENNNNNNIKMEAQEEFIQEKIAQAEAQELQEKLAKAQEMQEKRAPVILEEKKEEIKIQESNINVVDEDDEEDVDVEDEDEYEDDNCSIKDRQDDVRYEAIEEEFRFSGEAIKPCYCVLPFVSDEEVEGMTKRNIAVSIHNFKDYVFRKYNNNKKVSSNL